MAAGGSEPVNRQEKRLKCETASLLTSHENGLPLPDLEREYHETYGREMPFLRLGFVSALEFVGSVPDAVEVLPLPGGGVLCKAVARDALGDEGRPVKDDNKPVEEEEEEAFRKFTRWFLGRRYPGIVTAQDLVVEFNRTTESGRRFEMQEVDGMLERMLDDGQLFYRHNDQLGHGFSEDRSAWIVSLPEKADDSRWQGPQPEKVDDDDVRHKPFRTFTMLLLRSRYPNPATNRELMVKYNHDVENERSLTMKDVDAFVQRMYVEDDVLYRQGQHGGSWMVSLSKVQARAVECLLNGVPMSPVDRQSDVDDDDVDNFYPSVQKLPGGLKSGDCLMAVVTEIISPSKFYICLWTEGCKDALERLCDRMQKFYSGPGAGPPVAMSSGKLCAVKVPSGEWMRGLVLNAVDHVSVDVFFFDFGTKYNMLLSSIRRLEAEFKELPAQAIEARCAGILPKGGKKWDAEALNFFSDQVEKTANLGLWVMYMGVLKEPAFERVSLILIDTESNDREEGININRELLDEGYAIKDPDATARDNFDCIKFFVERAKALPPPARPAEPSVGQKAPPVIDRASGPAINGSLPRAKPPPPKPAEPSVGRKAPPVVDLPGPSEACLPDVARRADPALVRVVDLVDGLRIHTVNIDGKLRVPSWEISTLFPTWRGRDVLGQMLRLKNVTVPAKTFNSSEHSGFFEQCIIEGIEFPEWDGDMKATFYPLASVAFICRSLNNNSSSLLEALEEATAHLLEL